MDGLSDRGSIPLRSTDDAMYLIKRHMASFIALRRRRMMLQMWTAAGREVLYAEFFSGNF